MFKKTSEMVPRGVPKENLKNIDIDRDYLENFDIDIDKDILENIDNDTSCKILISIRYHSNKDSAYRTTLPADWGGVLIILILRHCGGV